MAESPFKLPGFSGFGNEEGSRKSYMAATSFAGLSNKYNKVTDATDEKPDNNKLISLLQEEDSKKEEVEQAIDTRDNNGKETLA